MTIDDQDRDIWIWDLRRSSMTRFTSDPAWDNDPVWTPDGQRLVFASNREGPVNLFWQAIGGGPIARLTNTPNAKQPFSVSPDGKRLIFGEQVQRYDIWSVNLNGEPRPEVVVQTRFGDRDADVSPDGRWLAYSSDDSGRFEIYVRSFAGEKRFPISTNGGGGAVWARSGRELFYRAANGDIMAVPVETTNGFSAGSAMKVFDGAPAGLGRMFDVSPDGKRFLMLKPTGASDQSAASTRLVAVLNWSEELKNRVPIRD